jgi:resuscitation-promoting factor RpfB
LREAPQGARKGREALAKGHVRKSAVALISSFLTHHRFRNHAGVLAALALISVLTFLLFPLRHVRVESDGSERTMVSRQGGTDALLRQAGVELQAGDRVEREDGASDGTALSVQRAVPVVLEADGRVLTWHTRARTVAGALGEAGVTLGPFDSLLRDGLRAGFNENLDMPILLVAAQTFGLRVAEGAAPVSVSADQVSLTVRRAVPFTVVEGDQPKSLLSSEPTLDQALREWDICLGPGDEVEPAVGSALTPGLQVVIRRAVRVTLSVGGTDTVIYTQAHTVEGLLAKAGVVLGETGRVEPSSDTALSPDLRVRVYSYAEDRLAESETVDHGTVYRLDPDLWEGETRRVVGADGVHHREYAVAYEDGVEVSRQLVKEWDDPEPIDTIVYFGSPEHVQAAQTLPDGLNVVRVMNVYATWYCPESAGRDDSDPSYGITSTGVPVSKGIVAVDPSVIPYGTRMYIPGYGFGEAADTGGAIVGNIIDLGYPDGISPGWMPRSLDIYILGP